MEFHEKLQELRKQNGLTQEALAQALFVSRTAISKWESGRGYPSIDSLKAIANYFGVSVDDLLSGEQILTIAAADQKQKKDHFVDLIFGLLDVIIIALLFLPLFGQEQNNIVFSVPLFALTQIAPYVKTAYYFVISIMPAFGILTLVLQRCENSIWLRSKRALSVALNALAVLIFILSPQPYAAAFFFIVLLIKLFFLVKKQ